jgi:hypothetical protein
MDEAFDEQDVLAANIGFVAEEYFDDLGLGALLLAVFGLDELADHGNLEGADEVGHEDECVLEDGEGLDGLSAIVVGDLAREFLYPLLDLLGSNDLAKYLDFRLVHF